LRRARLDNVALVPASLLPFREQYQTIANAMPRGAVLICTPSSSKALQLLEKVATNLRAEGYQVETLPASRLHDL
jgi:hypothetical protein